MSRGAETPGVLGTPGVSRGTETPGSWRSPSWACGAWLPSPGPGDSAVRSAVTSVLVCTAQGSPPTPCAPSVGPSFCPLSPVGPTAQDVRAKVGTQDVHAHVTVHALSSAGGPEPLPGALGRPEAPRWRNLSPPRWALLAKLDSDSLHWCFADGLLRGTAGSGSAVCHVDHGVRRELWHQAQGQPGAPAAASPAGLDTRRPVSDAVWGGGPSTCRRWCPLIVLL